MTGSAVLDLYNHDTLAQVTTPTPVRWIATDPTHGVAYLTLPESNQFLTYPIPTVSAN